MKSPFVVLIAAMFALLMIVSPLPASAQEVQTRIVNVPFSFHLNNATYEAGRYEITYNGPMHVYLVRSPEFKDAIYLHTVTVISEREPSTAGLAFNRYGNNYFLAQIWIGEHAGSLPTSKVEREVASRWQKGVDSTVVLATNNT